MPINETERQNNLASTKALWQNVMLQAMQDIIKPKGNPKEKRLYRESALYWLNDKTTDDINSFIGICGTLGLDPDKVRDKIMELKSERGFDVIF